MVNLEGEKVRKISELREDWRKNLPGKVSPTAMRILGLFFKHPSMSAILIPKKLDITNQAANREIRKLTEKGILLDTTGKGRKRIYVAKDLFDLLGPETDNQIIGEISE